MNEILESSTLDGYIIKHNTFDRIFYSPKTNLPIIKMYDYQSYEINNYSISKDMKTLYVKDKKLYISS